jgi:hypothetical protein
MTAWMAQIHQFLCLVMKKRILFFFFICLPCFSYAQDTAYVKTFEDYFLVKLGVSYRALNFTLSPRENGVTQFFSPIWYRPIVNSSISINAAFKGLSFGWSFGLAQNRIFSNKQTESKYFDFQMHSLLSSKWSYDFYYQDYQGYFIENLDSRLSWNGLEQRNDIRLKNVQANVSHIFNGNRFSYSAAFSHSKKQLKNAGSFTLTSSLGYMKAQGDSGFIPSTSTLPFLSNPKQMHVLWVSTRFLSLPVMPILFC